MDEQFVQIINQEVTEKFPYMENVIPEIELLPDKNFKLVYSGHAQTANGHDMPVKVIVKAAAAGKIINISSSR